MAVNKGIYVFQTCYSGRKWGHVGIYSVRWSPKTFESQQDLQQCFRNGILFKSFFCQTIFSAVISWLTRIYTFWIWYRVEKPVNLVPFLDWHRHGVRRHEGIDFKNFLRFPNGELLTHLQTRFHLSCQKMYVNWGEIDCGKVITYHVQSNVGHIASET